MGPLLGEIPALGTVRLWVRGRVQRSAEVSDLTNGGIKLVRGIALNIFLAEDVRPWLLSICQFPLNFRNISRWYTEENANRE